MPLVKERIIVVQKVWVQTTSDYNGVEKTRTLVVTPETTIGEVMRWAAAGNMLGRGDVVVLTEQDFMSGASGMES